MFYQKIYKITYIQRIKLHLGKALNTILTHVTSPLVIIASHLGKFDNSPDIERLIHVYESSGADIVGSAVKNINTGEWDRGCYQTQLKLYTLKYISGYHHSEHECLRCDFLKGPFLSSKNFLQTVGFNSNLTHGLYQDFFLRVKSYKSKLLSCPDVMFYTHQSVEFDFHFQDFANKWDIKKIIYSNGQVHWYGCRRGYAHTSKEKCDVEKGMGIPPCCMENLLDALNFTFRMCDHYKIKCELQEGSLLGAVKFHSLLPWEQDADLTVLSSDFSVFSNLSKAYEKQGYYIAIHEQAKCCSENGKLKGGVLHIRADGWSIQIYGQHELTTHHSDTRTKVKLANYFVNLPENPGLYARNRYGREIYKHAEHWLSSGLKSGWNEYISGKFNQCDKPEHHACLDQFEADGDLRFKV